MFLCKNDTTSFYFFVNQPHSIFCKPTTDDHDHEASIGPTTNFDVCAGYGQNQAWWISQLPPPTIPPPVPIRLLRRALLMQSVLRCLIQALLQRARSVSVDASVIGTRDFSGEGSLRPNAPRYGRRPSKLLTTRGDAAAIEQSVSSLCR